MKSPCLCCKKGLPKTPPRTCPECGHVFQGNGWDGIDAHWTHKHERKGGIPYREFWEGLCVKHGGRHA